MLFVLCGCATSAVDYDKAKPVPDDRNLLKTDGKFDNVKNKNIITLDAFI